jgi:hypothetical protein
MSRNFLESAKKQFKYYRILGDETISRINDESLFWQFNEESNSIAIIVNHLWGNMLSRWTDFLNSDGEKAWRQRDKEFEDIIRTREELLKKWNEGWDCLFEAMDSIDPNHLNTTVYIRNQGHTILEAINRQMGHYAYHVGQMVFIGKMVCGSAWKSLSIPKGGSAFYNADKFAQEKSTGHFTDDVRGKDATAS